MRSVPFLDASRWRIAWPVERRALRAFMLAVVASAAWASLGGTALAVVTPVKVGAETTTVGMEPRSLHVPTQLPNTVGSFDNPSGAPVMHSSAIYAIYWDPEYGYHGDWEHSINTFLQRLGTASNSLGSVNAVTEQYTDKTNSHAAFSTSFRGAYSDVKLFPSNGCVDPDLSFGFPDEEAHKDNIACLTDGQLRQELQAFIASNGLSTGMGTIFYLLTPPGVTVCVDKGESISAYCSDNAPATESGGHSFCSYHSYINPTNAPEGDGSTVIYSVIPWTAGGLGDFQLFDQAPGYECQDGGYDPTTSKPIEQPEKELHQQEPNQEPSHVGPDGAYDGGLADLIVNQVSVEQRNTITNPLLDGWQDSAGNEVVDECRNFFAATVGGINDEQKTTGAGTLYNQVFGEGRYYLNTTLNLASFLQRYPGIPCIPGIELQPQFTSPDPVNSGEIVGFDARESDVTLDAGTGYEANGTPFETFPTYSWSFGDGTTANSPYPSGAAPVDQPSVFHSYQYGGTYTVTLTVTDVGGNTTARTGTIHVDGPPPPSSSSAGTSSGASSTASAPPPAPASGTTSASPTVVKAPRVFEKVASYSLKKALRYGLAVSYYANEQIAGGAQVMIDKRLAKRLHIKGPLATGMPKGYSSQVVIGGQVLITTTAGNGMLRFKLSKQLVKRLAHVHKLKVTLRIVVRNADRAHPQTATLLSTVVLK